MLGWAIDLAGFPHSGETTIQIYDEMLNTHNAELQAADAIVWSAGGNDFLAARADYALSCNVPTCFVGDSLKDVQAAIAAGCEPVLVRTGHGRTTEDQATALGVTGVYDDLAQFAEEYSQEMGSE